jgi:glutamate-1-semialdehyde 2,1-aminomutase
MELGGFDHERERVFVLSTTHGAETHALAAAIATMDVYTTRPVIETLRARGARLRKGFDSVVQAHGLSKQLQLMSRDCNLLFVTRDSREHPSQEFRTLFMQELVRGGVLAPSFVVGFSHSESDIDATLEAVQRALPVYAAALSDGVGRFLEGPPVKPAFRPRA